MPYITSAPVAGTLNCPSGGAPIPFGRQSGRSTSSFETRPRKHFARRRERPSSRLLLLPGANGRKTLACNNGGRHRGKRHTDCPRRSKGNGRCLHHLNTAAWAARGLREIIVLAFVSTSEESTPGCGTEQNEQSPHHDEAGRAVHGIRKMHKTRNSCSGRMVEGGFSCGALSG